MNCLRTSEILSHLGVPYAQGYLFGYPMELDVALELARVEGTSALKGAHPDCVQTQRGAGAIRIDRFTCTTELQGIFLKVEGGERLGACEIRNANITGAPGKHLFFQTTRDIRVTVSNLWLHTDRPWAPFGFQVFPQKDGRTIAGG